jgi:drug/metabolite transporter (DMT)-like permease
MSFTPAISAILAYFFLNEQISFIGIIGMIITLAGIILVVFDKKDSAESPHKHEALGILYGALGALGQAVGLIFAKLAFEESNINGFVATFIRLFSATIIIIPIFVLLKRYKNPITLYRADKKGLGLTLGGTFFGPFLGITLSLIAITNTKVGFASTLMATVPVIMLPIGKFVFKDHINLKAIVGAVIAVAGVAILFLR